MHSLVHRLSTASHYKGQIPIEIRSTTPRRCVMRGAFQNDYAVLFNEAFPNFIVYPFLVASVNAIAKTTRTTNQAAILLRVSGYQFPGSRAMKTSSFFDAESIFVSILLTPKNGLTQITHVRLELEGGKNW